MATNMTVEVSPKSWKEASIRSIQLAQTIIDCSDDTIGESRRTDPLPLLRDACVKVSRQPCCGSWQMLAVTVSITRVIISLQHYCNSIWLALCNRTHM